MQNAHWMIYGANGYTGKLIAEQAKQLGMQPILAGRSAPPIIAIAESLELDHRVFNLYDQRVLDRSLNGLSLVLNCAGPFSTTAEPLMQACLRQGIDYLDITGEIDVFTSAHSKDGLAKRLDSVLCPGVGFDVIPTDCLARALKERMPEAVELALGFDSQSKLSPGTAKTTVESLGKGCQIRHKGALIKVPLGYRTREINFGNGEKSAMTIPWGDVATAYYSTGIGNIEVYVPMPPKLISRITWLRPLSPLLNLSWVQSLLKKQVDKRIAGPSEQERQSSKTFVWGQVKNPDGEQLTARLMTANGYDLTIHGALHVVEQLLSNSFAGGYYTPSALLGWQMVEGLPGSGKIEFSAS